MQRLRIGAAVVAASLAVVSSLGALPAAQASGTGFENREDFIYQGGVLNVVELGDARFRGLASSHGL